ncbi:MAG: sulfotransferase [Planctomycetota bacterium]
MTPVAVEQRVFVVGVPRSGTTLVQSLVAAHTEITSFTESHFFSRHFRLLPPWSTPVLTRDPRPRLAEFLAENGVDPEDAVAGPLLGAAAVARPWPRPLLPLRTREVAGEFLQLLDRLALRRGKTRWLEKTPRHLRFAPLLQRLTAPGQTTRFVHVIRDGLEVVASLLAASRRWERAYDLDECVRRWNADVEFATKRLAGSTADHFVFYEDLTANPEAAVRRLLDELDLAWEPDLLQRYAATASSLVTEDETWKAGVGAGIRPSATSAHALSEAQRARAVGRLRHDLYEQLRTRPPRAADLSLGDRNGRR